jgi:hypothetical protein
MPQRDGNGIYGTYPPGFVKKELQQHPANGKVVAVGDFETFFSNRESRRASWK